MLLRTYVAHLTFRVFALLPYIIPFTYLQNPYLSALSVTLLRPVLDTFHLFRILFCGSSHPRNNPFKTQK